MKVFLALLACFPHINNFSGVVSWVLLLTKMNPRLKKQGYLTNYTFQRMRVSWHRFRTLQQQTQKLYKPRFRLPSQQQQKNSTNF